METDRTSVRSQELDVVLFRVVVPTIYNIIEGRTLPNSRDCFRVNIMTTFSFSIMCVCSVGRYFTINLPPQPTG